MANRKRACLLEFGIKDWTFFLIFFLFSSCWVTATEYEPWLGNVYEFELRSSLVYQKYKWLSSDSHLKKYSSDDVFLDLSLCYFLPNPFIGLEFEIIEACTRKQKGDIDHFKLTGRYVWQDDIAGDSWSLTTGGSYSQAFQKSLRDVSSFHHGLYEGEIFLSIGQEFPDEILWDSRWWSIFAIGFAERGSPWFRFHLDYEKRWWEKHEMKICVASLWGLGGNSLHFSHFQGYGSVQHQSIDLSVRYTYLLEFYGNFSLEYSYRPYARNFPAYAHHLLARLLYTFGL